VAEWEPLVDDDLVGALLAGLVQFEDALNELAG